MTTKMFCDGCDAEIADRRGTTVSIKFSVAPGAQHPSTPDFDLCESCLNQFRFRSLPKTWPRVAPPAPRLVSDDAA